MNTPEPNFQFRVGQPVLCRLTQYPGVVTKNRLDEQGEPLVEVLVNQYGAPPVLREWVCREYELEAFPI